MVFALFEGFVKMHKLRLLVPFRFLDTIVLSSLAGLLVARFYSEPMNRTLRKRWGEGTNQLDLVVEAGSCARNSEVMTA